MPSLHQLLVLARVPNLPTVWSNVLLGWFLSGAGLECGWALAACLVGGTLVYAGGCTWNDAFDAAWDQRHKPDRLIPAGHLSRAVVWGIGAIELAAGLLLLILSAPSTWYWPVALVMAVTAYNARHKETPLSVIVMGSCRFFLILTAAAAGAGVAGRESFPGWAAAAAAVVWLYIIGLSLLARRENRPGGSWLRALRPTWSVGRWVGEMLAAIPLLDSLLLAMAGAGRAAGSDAQGASGAPPTLWLAAVLCLALWPLCRLLQRKYAAT